MSTRVFMLNPEFTDIQAAGFTPPAIQKLARTMHFNIDRFSI
nr:hypothetical protein [uncultured Glaciecola sp.]